MQTPCAPSTRYLLLLLIGFLNITSSPLTAEERQAHGLHFERWVRLTFFDNYQPELMTQKWDIPAEANVYHGHLPATVKTSRYGSQIDLGDALRQFDIATKPDPFLFIIGFWQPHKKTQKHWIHAVAPIVTAKQYLQAWHPITYTDLKDLDTLIKDRTLTIAQARQQAHLIKSRPPFNQSIIKVNPKIDINQRRLQCSISFDDFFQHLAPAEASNLPTTPTLFNLPVPPTLPIPTPPTPLPPSTSLSKE